tara:strand:+ start:44687 stop:45928 length:1242 start_codon:yes stop_codon:yes gene_type:complete
MNKIDKKASTNLILTGVFLFGIYPLIPHEYESLSVILLALCSVIYLLITTKDKKYIKTFFITSSIYIVLFISALFSNNKLEGFKIIETMLSLIVFPIIFYLLLGKSNINLLRIRLFFLKTYFISSLIFSIISFYLFTIYKNARYLLTDSNFYRNAILDNNYIGDHPIYISIYISIAIIFGFYFLDKIQKFSLNFFLILIAQGCLISLLFLLMSKGVILALIIVFILKLILFDRIKKVYIFSCILAFSLIFILIPEKNNRFKEVFNFNTYKTLDSNNSTSIRVVLYKCGLESVFKNYLYGYGVGDVQETLDECYFHNNSNFIKGMYNSHNQYLFIWLSGGILSFLLFIGILFYYLKKALEYNDRVMFSVLVLYCIIFLFENALSRQSGVILFSFMMNYFLWDNFNKIKIKKLSL